VSKIPDVGEDVRRLVIRTQVVNALGILPLAASFGGGGFVS